MNFLEKTIKEYEKNLPFDGQFSPPPLRGGDGGTGGVQFLGLYTPVLFY